MKIDEYRSFDGLGLAELLATSQVSADELTACAVELIAQENPKLNAVISQLEGQPYSEEQPFSGVPFLVKELVLQATGGLSRAGSGAAVAAGILPIAHANDGGGSIRVSASCNGLVGLKPTRDRIPTGPGTSDPLFGQAIEFVVSRTVRDSAALLDCVAGPDQGAAHIIAPPPTSFRQAAATPPGKLTIGILQGSMLGTPIHPENASALDQTTTSLAGLGQELVECNYVLDFEEFAEHINVFWCAFAAQFVDQVTQGTGCAADNDHFEAVTLTCLATPPPRHGTLNQNDATISAMDWTRNTFRYATNTPLFNATGQPAITLPLHWTTDNLPVGIQFAAAMGDEGMLLSLASQLEEESNWQQQQHSLWQQTTSITQGALR